MKLSDVEVRNTINGKKAGEGVLYTAVYLKMRLKPVETTKERNWGPKDDLRLELRSLDHSPRRHRGEGLSRADGIGRGTPSQIHERLRKLGTHISHAATGCCDANLASNRTASEFTLAIPTHPRLWGSVVGGRSACECPGCREFAASIRRRSLCQKLAYVHEPAHTRCPHEITHVSL